MQNSDDNLSNKLQESRKDYFGSKYSEHVHGKDGGRITDSSKTSEGDEVSIKQFWKEVEQNESYKRKMTYDDKKKQGTKEKLISSSKIFEDLRPKYFKRNFSRFLESITPEEIEALIAIKNNFFKEWKKASFTALLVVSPIMLYFRSIVSYKFIFVNSFFFPLLVGFFMGGYLNSKKAIVLIDRMGNEYQLSRIYKQTIFTKRKDLTEEMKAEIYMKMNREKENLDNSVSEENQNGF